MEDVVQRLLDIGSDHIGIADTIGVGTAGRVTAVMERALKHVPLAELSGHFHDTYGQALTNIYASLTLGIHIFDTSIAGLGGCPYAKGATGNVATEDVVYLLHGLGITTGIDLDRLGRRRGVHLRRTGPQARLSRQQRPAGQAPAQADAGLFRWPSCSTRHLYTAPIPTPRSDHHEPARPEPPTG